MKNIHFEKSEYKKEKGVKIMPVFDFKHTPDEKKAQECTYTTFRSNETEATAEKPMRDSG